MAEAGRTQCPDSLGGSVEAASQPAGPAPGATGWRYPGIKPIWWWLQRIASLWVWSGHSWEPQESWGWGLSGLTPAAASSHAVCIYIYPHVGLAAFWECIVFRAQQL